MIDPADLDALAALDDPAACDPGRATLAEIRVAKALARCCLARLARHSHEKPEWLQFAPLREPSRLNAAVKQSFAAWLPQARAAIRAMPGPI